jgi:hypothetical protein
MEKSRAHLVHFCQSTLAELFERAHFSGFLLSCEVHFTVASLTDLSDDVELVDFELGAAFAQDDTLTTAIRLELFGIFCARQRSSFGIGIELSSSILASSNISQQLEVVV